MATKRPNTQLRFKTKTQFEKVKRAARIEGVSLNEFVIDTLDPVAERIIVEHTRKMEQVRSADNQPEQLAV